jgi:hypothetical protein
MNLVCTCMATMGHNLLHQSDYSNLSTQRCIQPLVYSLPVCMFGVKSLENLLLGHPHVMGMSFCSCRVSSVFLLLFLCSNN